jgi:hypothetical protein
MITDFIYKMPEKIKDLRNRNEEVSRLIDDSYANQTTAGVDGGLGSSGRNPYFQHGSGNLQGSLYHHSIYGANQQTLNSAKAAANPANENHDFEDFLNLVRVRSFTCASKNSNLSFY